MKKTESLITYLRGLNPLVKYISHSEHIRPDNAEKIVSQYDVVLDCTDRPPGRYLISDVCVLLEKPLVTAAALRTDGQLIVLNSPPTPPGSAFGSPCYRCVWKKSPTARGKHDVWRVRGARSHRRYHGHDAGERGDQADHLGQAYPIPCARQAATPPALLIFADWRSFGLDKSAIRSVPMGKKPGCIACGPGRTITLKGIASGEPNYDDFCGLRSSVGPAFSPMSRISPTQYQQLRDSRDRHLLLDVREPEHFSISALPGAVNVRFRDVSRWLAAYDAESKDPAPATSVEGKGMPWQDEEYAGQNIWVVCRTGLDSQDVVAKMLAKGLDKRGGIQIGEIAGGMRAWRDEVDKSMPFV